MLTAKNGPLKRLDICRTHMYHSVGTTVLEAQQGGNQAMMRFGWFQDPDNVVYADVDQFADHFGKEAGIENFRTKLENFKANPTAEGILLKGRKRTTVKLFIPDLYFADKKTKLEMGDTVWVYMGEYYPCYCVYWPQAE